MTTINNFHDDFAFLSNFYPGPISYKGKDWPTVEHAFQAQKSLDAGEQELIRAARTPGKAKRMGRPKGSGGPPENVRRNRVVVTLTDAELAKLRKWAKDRDLPLGTVAYEIVERALRRRIR